MTEISIYQVLLASKDFSGEKCYNFGQGKDKASFFKDLEERYNQSNSSPKGLAPKNDIKVEGAVDGNSNKETVSKNESSTTPDSDLKIIGDTINKITDGDGNIDFESLYKVLHPSHNPELQGAQTGRHVWETRKTEQVNSRIKSNASVVPHFKLLRQLTMGEGNPEELRHLHGYKGNGSVSNDARARNAQLKIAPFSNGMSMSRMALPIIGLGLLGAVSVGAVGAFGGLGFGSSS